MNLTAPTAEAARVKGKAFGKRSILTVIQAMRGRFTALEAEACLLVGLKIFKQTRKFF